MWVIFLPGRCFKIKDGMGNKSYYVVTNKIDSGFYAMPTYRVTQIIPTKDGILELNVKDELCIWRLFSQELKEKERKKLTDIVEKSIVLDSFKKRDFHYCVDVVKECDEYYEILEYPFNGGDIDINVWENIDFGSEIKEIRI